MNANNRDLPRLLSVATSTGQKEGNTQLSLDETYADIRPVRNVGDVSAFVSIMRGCNNMCSCKLLVVEELHFYRFSIAIN
jgi:tRNA A37 methylthiotransferase MiaB